MLFEEEQPAVEKYIAVSKKVFGDVFWNALGEMIDKERKRRDLYSAYLISQRQTRRGYGIALQPEKILLDSNAYFRLATAYELQITLVTDDIDLVELATWYEHPVISSMELMQKMLFSGGIAISDTRSVAAMWTYDENLPAHFRTEYVRLFCEEPEAF